MTVVRTSVEEVTAAIAGVPDPEVPVVTIEDLGILRGIDVDEAAGRLTVTITPTYSGCPAMEVIERTIVHAAARCGWRVDVVTVLSPAWTTDWMNDQGRKALQEFGIAAPQPVSVTVGRRTVTCPQCGSDDTEELSRFGSTACKALRRCRSCREPFDEFKAI